MLNWVFKKKRKFLKVGKIVQVNYRYLGILLMFEGVKKRKKIKLFKKIYGVYVYFTINYLLINNLEFSGL